MLKCVKDFRQYEHDYKGGDVVSVAPAAEAWLLDSFPAYFERVAEVPAVEAVEVEIETRDIETPPADKAIKRAPKRK